MKNPILLLKLLFALTAQAQLPTSDWQKMNLNGKVRLMKEFNFDEKLNGDTIRKGKLNTVTQYLFDEKGYLREELVTNPDSVILFRSVYTYDNNNILLGKDIFLGRGPSTIQHRYKFSPKGNLMEETQFRSLNLEFTTQYEYNKAGMPVQKNILNWVYPDQSFKETFKYDDKGRLIEKYTDRVSVEYRREFYTYDDKGILTKTGYAKKKAPAEVYLEYAYEWDPNSNWLTQVEKPSSKNWKDKHFRERSFKYF